MSMRPDQMTLFLLWAGLCVIFAVGSQADPDDETEKDKRFAMQYNDLDSGFGDNNMVDWGQMIGQDKRFGAAKREFGEGVSGLDGDNSYSKYLQKWSGSFGRSGRSGFGDASSQLDGDFRNALGNKLQNWRRSFYKRTP